MNIEIPLKTFYQRCLNKYGIGETSLAKVNFKEKFCFNPYFATEYDVQVKLGGIIEEYFISNILPYTVNSEMKIYSSPYKKADLSIHQVSPETLYTEIDSPIKNLEVAFEVKYANAKNPDNEFKNDLILPDLEKLESLPKNVKKIFVFIDEADGLSKRNIQSLMNECKLRNICLFSNNKTINQKQNFPYR